MNCMLTVLALLALPALATLVVRRTSGARAPTSVQLDALGVRRMRDTQVTEAIAWSELVAVHVATTDDGPFADDLFWLLQAADGTGCAVSGPDAERIDLLAHLSRLPGFDHAAVVSACGSTENALFSCWRGAPGDGLAAAG